MIYRLEIIRGLPGSGKSTAAREIASLFTANQVIICSADDFFCCDYKHNNSGDYKFNPELLGEAHAWCRGQAELAMKLDIECVIIDNTNTRKWEYKPYLLMAARFEYEVNTTIIGKFDEESIKLYAERNTHGVPFEAIQRMADRFER